MPDQEFKTPMMQQYLSIKKDYPDCLLFFRMGDFYELFLEDAKIGSEIMDIALTARSKGSDGKIPMCGVPFHSVDSYLAKIIRSGHKVAICEQTSKPKPGNELVERKVVRILTPGTIVDENLLSTKANNFLTTFLIFQQKITFAYADTSTGEFFVKELSHSTENNSNQLYQNIQNEIKRLNPSEIILTNDLYHNYDLLNQIQNACDANIYPFKTENKKSEAELTHIKEFFKIKTLDAFNISEENEEAIKTIYILLCYIQNNFKSGATHINKITSANDYSSMRMDADTINNLEIFQTNRVGSSKSKNLSLFDVLNKTSTAMGVRLLRSWVIYPLIKETDIIERQNYLESLIQNKKTFDDLEQALKTISDLERICSRLGTGRSNPRDLLNLANSLKNSLILVNFLKAIPKLDTLVITDLTQQLEETINSVITKIDSAIKENAPLSIRDGNIIKDNYSKDLDQIKLSIKDSKDWIVKLEALEKQRTGISTLKVGFNSVFGYYIEITKAQANQAPAHYIRKQTLVNAERYITQELKEKEEIVLKAEEKINEIESEIYQNLVLEIAGFIKEIQIVAKSVAKIDALFSLAKTALYNNYTKPQILTANENCLEIIEGRHPIVEKSLNSGEFTPNDSLLNSEKFVHIITGPNMAGKSTYIRQIALIQLLAQIGSYVPAYQAKISIVDGIYTRIGAGDALAQGLSTFMVEMIETAKILNNATEHSLVILDEVGRGTGTKDGLSIAKAIIEYIHTKIKCKTLFATHFHELIETEKIFKGLQNYHVKIIDKNGEIKFLHRIEKGGANKSYGIEVAKIAGIPLEVIEKAKEYLNNSDSKKQLSLF